MSAGRQQILPAASRRWHLLTATNTDQTLVCSIAADDSDSICVPLAIPKAVSEDTKSTHTPTELPPRPKPQDVVCHLQYKPRRLYVYFLPSEMAIIVPCVTDEATRSEMAEFIKSKQRPTSRSLRLTQTSTARTTNLTEQFGLLKAPTVLIVNCDRYAPFCIGDQSIPARNFSLVLMNLDNPQEARANLW